MRKLPFIFVLLIVWVGCKKHELPNEENGTPYFEISGDLNGESFEFIAGENRYFHAPGHTVDEFQVFNFESAFHSEEPEVNRESFRIVLTDDHISSDGNSSAVDLLNADNFHFDERTIDMHYSVQFSPDLLGTPVSYLWDFGDGQISNEENPDHIYSDPSIKKYVVCLAVEFGNGCLSQLCSEIFMPDAGCSGDFIAEEKVDSLTGNYWDFRAQALTGKEPFVYHWTFEDNVNGYSNHIWYQYVMEPIDGVELACVEITDAEQCISRVCKNVVIDSALAQCAVNFNFLASQEQLEDSINLNRANVIYTNSAGVEFSSANVEQPTWARLAITDVAPYAISYNGQSTVEAQVSVTCILANSTGETLTLNSGQGKIAFPSGVN